MMWEATDVDGLTAEAPNLLRQLHIQRQLYPAPHRLKFGAAAVLRRTSRQPGAWRAKRVRDV